MMEFLFGLILGFLLGAAGGELRYRKAQKEQQDAYIQKLERVSNLAELMIHTRKTENERLDELKKVVAEVGQAVAALQLRGGKDMH